MKMAFLMSKGVVWLISDDTINSLSFLASGTEGLKKCQGVILDMDSLILSKRNFRVIFKKPVLTIDNNLLSQTSYKCPVPLSCPSTQLRKGPVVKYI